VGKAVTGACGVSCEPANPVKSIFVLFLVFVRDSSSFTPCFRCPFVQSFLFPLHRFYESWYSLSGPPEPIVVSSPRALHKPERTGIRGQRGDRRHPHPREANGFAGRAEDRGGSRFVPTRWWVGDRGKHGRRLRSSIAARRSRSSCLCAEMEQGLAVLWTSKQKGASRADENLPISPGGPEIPRARPFGWLRASLR